MINRLLMELCDDYLENKNVDKLVDFAKKTFPNDGTDQLFVGCMLILITLGSPFKPRYICTRENLLAVVVLAKEKIGTTNLLDFYVDRVNQYKGIKKQLENIVRDPNLDKYADVIIDYLEQFKLDLITKIKNHKKLNKYINSFNKIV